MFEKFMFENFKVKESGVKTKNIITNWLKSPGLKSSWLKSPGINTGVENPGLNIGVENFGVEMSCNLDLVWFSTAWSWNIASVLVLKLHSGQFKNENSWIFSTSHGLFSSFIWN